MSRIIFAFNTTLNADTISQYVRSLMNSSQCFFKGKCLQKYYVSLNFIERSMHFKLVMKKNIAEKITLQVSK